MSTALFYTLIGAGLFSIGLYHLLARRVLISRILALNVAGTGVFLVLVALAYQGPDGDPDPVPHAMVLTGLVVAISATAFALALASRVREVTGRGDLEGGDSHDS